MIKLMFSLLSAALVFTPLELAAQDAPDAAIDETVRAEVIESLSQELAERYVFPDVAAEVSAELANRIANGGYADLDTAQGFASSLHDDLRAIGNDGHFQLFYAPDLPERRDTGSTVPSAEQVEQARRQHAQVGYGIPHVERLAGNIGYLDVHGFYRPEFVGAAYEAAMQLLAGSDAIIVDLRSNGGGDPQSVAQLMSHFFARGDERHINSIYNRPSDTTREFWTDPTVATRYTGPVFVITSGYTFSGGEEFAYDMQTHERGTLIGETTGGGANPGATVKLAHGFAAFIPDGRAINPVTGTNWEHVGVKPDRDVPAGDALKAAHVAAIEAVIADETDETRARSLREVLAEIAAGTITHPAWSDPREG